MCVGQYAYLRVRVCVATTFYTKVCILSLFVLGVALHIVICPPPLTQGRLWRGERFINFSLLLFLSIRQKSMIFATSLIGGRLLGGTLFGCALMSELSAKQTEGENGSLV